WPHSTPEPWNGRMKKAGAPGTPASVSRRRVDQRLVQKVTLLALDLGTKPRPRSLSTNGAMQLRYAAVPPPRVLRHSASAACRLAPPIRPGSSSAGMPVLQLPPLVVALPAFSVQPRSWYRAGVRSRRTLASVSDVFAGSISALGEWLVSKCENEEPVARTAGEYTSARPVASVPA